MLTVVVRSCQNSSAPLTNCLQCCRIGFQCLFPVARQRNSLLLQRTHFHHCVLQPRTNPLHLTHWTSHNIACVHPCQLHRSSRQIVSRTRALVARVIRPVRYCLYHLQHCCSRVNRVCCRPQL